MTIQDIVNYIYNWRSNNGCITSREQAIQFNQDLQGQISQMDFSAPEGSSIITYSGKSGSVFNWQIATRQWMLMQYIITRWAQFTRQD